MLLKMSFPNHIYLLSNGSTNIFTSNSLTSFSNKLPTTFETNKNENIVVSVESIGFATNFRNIYIPDDEKTPSIVVHSEGGLKVNEFFMGDQWYTLGNLKNFIYEFNRQNHIKIEFVNDKQLIFKKTEDTNPIIIMLHETFVKTFNIPFSGVKTKNFITGAYGVVNSHASSTEASIRYKGELYYTFILNNVEIEKVGGVFSLKSKSIPKIVKVQSSIIDSQILNDQHEKDLLCFCPNFKSNNPFFFKEFEQPQKVKISNTILKEIDIKLVDEKNNKIQLLSGIPTIVKLKFEKMPTQDKTFNVRLTSQPTKLHPNNAKNSFKIKLPDTLHFNKKWRVALTSVTHPNKYNTFIGSGKERGFYFKEDLEEREKEFFFESKIYSENEVVKAFNDFLLIDGVRKGSFVKVGAFYELNLFVTGQIVIGNNVLDVLGYTGVKNNRDNYTHFLFNKGNKTVYQFNFERVPVYNSTTGEQMRIVRFDGSFKLDALHPEYMIAYCNIVQPSPIGEIFSNILGVIPISKNDDIYVLKEFKNKSYYELSNSEISEIEINFRSHDGSLIEFSGDQNVIVNLEFTNSV